MSKTNWGSIILLGAVALGGYFLYKWLSDNGGSFFGGGGSGGGGTTTTTTTTTWEEPVPIIIDGTKVTVPNIPIPKGGFLPVDYIEMHNRSGVRQVWTGQGASYGNPGQPSIAFKENTLKATPKVQGVGTVSPRVIVTLPSKTVTIAKPLAVSKGVPVVTIKATPKAVAQAQLAKSAILAGAPPRVVAKIKGGTWY